MKYAIISISTDRTYIFVNVISCQGCSDEIESGHELILVKAVFQTEETIEDSEGKKFPIGRVIVSWFGHTSAEWSKSITNPIQYGLY